MSVRFPPLMSHVLQGGVAYLPDLSVTGSSEAILQGQKPPFRLMARAVSAVDGSHAAHIRPAISEAFVVGARTNQSAEKLVRTMLPCVER